jgi:hypothetical protein
MQTLMQQFAQSSSPENFKLYSKNIQAGATITANQYWNNFGCSGFDNLMSHGFILYFLGPATIDNVVLAIVC